VARLNAVPDPKMRRMSDIVRMSGRLSMVNRPLPVKDVLVTTRVVIRYLEVGTDYRFHYSLDFFAHFIRQSG
jgi:hypothetical protein